MDREEERWNLDFVVSKSIRYHSYRRAFWDNWDRLAKVLTILSGTAVLITLIGADKDTTTSIVFAAIVAVVSAADLVVGFSGKARDP